MTHFWQIPQVITVAITLEGHPVGLTWQGEYHPIRVIANRWRDDTGWWLWRKRREYLRLLTQTGMLVEIYHDKETQTWYLQRLYD